jgi:restriction endonuclease Mrr
MTDFLAIGPEIQRLLGLLESLNVAPPGFREAPVESLLLVFLRRLDPSAFETLVGRSFENVGHEVKHCGGSGDEGVDFLVQDSQGTVAVQCKRYESDAVVPREIREFLGAVTAIGAVRGVFVTTSKFTDAARDFGARHGIELVDESSIVQWLVRFPSGCAKCGGVGPVESLRQRWGWTCPSCYHDNLNA